MSTENQAQSEDFSPAEMAYINSGGADTDGLASEWGSDGQAAPDGQSQQKTQDAAPGAPDGQQQGNDEVIDGEIVIDANGRPKDKTTGRFVPHGAFHKEREKRKATEQELEAMREKFTRADERMQLLNDLLGNDGQQAQQKKDVEDDTPPDPEKDIFAFVKWQTKQIEKLQSRLTETADQTNQREQARSTQQIYQADAMRFMQEQPAFRDAYQFLLEGRSKELEAVGVSDAGQRQRMIADEERGIVEQALKAGKSPSQLIYSLATARGFVPKAQQQQQSANERVAAIKRGQQNAGPSLSNAGGSSGEGLTTEALANMSEEEFDAVVSKLSKSQRMQLLGA